MRLHTTHDDVTGNAITQAQGVGVRIIHARVDAGKDCLTSKLKAHAGIVLEYSSNCAINCCLAELRNESSQYL